MSELNVISYPVKNALLGKCIVPGDKSISHRALLFAAIAVGRSTINDWLNCDDCNATLKAIRALGVYVEGPYQDQLMVYGVGKYGLKQPQQILDCGNSGTSMRLLAGLLAAQPFNSVLTGDTSLLKRPMLRISEPLAQMGANIKTHQGKPPIVIEGDQHLSGITYVMPVASAQVKSCLLLAGMYASGSTTLIEPNKTRDHTERMLKAFSYPIEQDGNIIKIDPHGTCQGTEITVPKDISSAAFFIVAATLIPKSSLMINNVGINETRIGVIDVLLQMGARIDILNKRYVGEECVADLLIVAASLHGIDIHSSLIPITIDEFPILFIAAACAEGKTTLVGAKELRTKESDRIEAMVEGLTALGIEVEAFNDGISITGGVLGAGTVDSYGDHRIALSFMIAGALAKGPVTIKNCACVDSSFPEFIPTANKMALKIKEL